MVGLVQPESPYVPTAKGRWLDVAPAYLVLTALFIDVAFGRWGSYMRTPIPGFYLPDALLLAGALMSLPFWRNILLLPRRVVWVFGLALVYIPARILAVVVMGSSDDAYLVIRDLAPFAYLALAPFVAVSLSRVRSAWVLWTLRVAALINLSALAGVSLGLISAFPSGLLGSANVMVLESRGDLQGVILGIGVLAWGTWRGIARGNRIVQFLFVVAGVQLGARAALIAFLVAVALSAFRERRWIRPWKLVACTLFAVAFAVPFAAVSTQVVTWLNQRQLSVVEQAEGQQGNSPKVPAFAGVSKFGSADGAGTTSARLATYTLVVSGMSRDSLWALGSGPGTDVLYELCTGLKQAPPRTMITEVGRAPVYLPKCPVDSSEAPSTMRDPHNWLLNLLIYNGVVGTAILLAALLIPLWAYRRSTNASLSIATIALYFVCGSFGVIISSPFGMLPISIMLAWLTASTWTARISTSAR